MEYSYTKRALLRELSENSRVSVSELAQKTKHSRNTIISNLKFLEKEFGVRYTLEFDIQKLGYTHTQISFIKFGIKPTLEEIKDAFKGGENYIIFLAVTEGDSDLILKTIADTSTEYIYWGIGIYQKLIRFDPVIRSSNIVSNIIGFMPLPSSVIEKFDLTKIKMDSLDKKILILLNKDCRMTYNEIARELKENTQTIRYRLQVLDKSKLIRRYTIVLEKPPQKHILVYNYSIALTSSTIENYKRSLDYYADVEGSLPFTNKFFYVSSAIGMYNTIGMAYFDNLDEVIATHKRIFEKDKIDIKHSKILNVIYGSVPIQNADIKKIVKQRKDEIRAFGL
ncbi:MAG: Lrp/AsnC family transcriptional regulator [Candidatus Micrarchaeota archaeon]|nr:Lrp/AsnC family transcriptional regulator [Candidatus Micrarchaeota archaeon]